MSAISLTTLVMNNSIHEQIVYLVSYYHCLFQILITITSCPTFEPHLLLMCCKFCAATPLSYVH